MKYLLYMILLAFIGCASPEEHAANERRHAERDLQNKFARYSTEELKLMHKRYSELRKDSTGRDLNITINPLARRIWGDSDTQNTERVLEIERELMRRKAAGDASATLP